MRPLHLLIALIVIAAALTGVWTLVSGERVQPAVIAGPGEEEVAPSAVDLQFDESATTVPEGASSSRAGGVERVAASVEEIAPAPQVQAPTPERSVTGRVLAPDGSAVVGASVFASTGGSWYRLPLDVETEGLPRRWKRAKTATTDARGRFTVRGLEPGALSLVVRAQGFIPHRDDHGTLLDADHGSSEDAPDPEQVELEDIRLQPGIHLQGTVIDPAGKGLEGVTIVQSIQGRGVGPELTGRGVQVGVTAADGTFVIDELAPGPFELLFDSDAYRVSSVRGRTSEIAGPIFVRLEDGDRIEGRVVDIDPAVATTLRIVARPVDSKDSTAEGDTEPEPRRARHAECAADGSFRIAGLQPQGRYRLTAWKPTGSTARGGGWRRAGAVRTKRVVAGETGVELEYRPRAEVLFRVVDDVSGAPLEELSVWVGVGRLRALRDEDGEPLREHPDGRVHYDELSVREGGAPVHVRVGAPGYLPFERDDLLLEPGEVRDLQEIRLQPSAALGVRVVDREGRPVEGARVVSRDLPREEFQKWAVVANDNDIVSDPRVQQSSTGSDGRASVHGVAGVTHYVVVAADGFLPSDELFMPIPLLSDGIVEREVVLERGGSVLVRVLDPGGRPIPRVRVRHRRPGETEESRGRRRQRLTTAEDGTVLVSGLEPGIHGFRLDDTQGRRVWDDRGAGTGWLDAVVNGGETAELDFVAPPRSHLSGTVTEGGLPIEGALVSLSPETERKNGRAYRGPDDPLSTRTDHEGRYLLEDVRAGRYTVFATHAGRVMPERSDVELTGVDRELDIDLSMSTIEGRVTDPQGEPLEGIELLVESPTGEFKSFRPYQLVIDEDERGSLRARYELDEPDPVVSDRDGYYVLHGVASDVELTVRAVDPFVVRRRSKPMTLLPGEVRRDVDFKLVQAGKIAMRLEGQAQDSDGSKGWYRVRATRLPDPQGKSKKIRMETRNSSLSTWSRRRTLESVRPGRWRLELFAGRRGKGGEAVATRTVTVKANGTARTVFKL